MPKHPAEKWGFLVVNRRIW